MTQSQENAPGEVLHDRYEIQRQLGKNAGRRTLLARDLQTQELVVVKLLSFDNDFEWDDLKLFQREAEMLKALSHPATPQYLDYFELELTYGKGFAFVQNYVEGRSLEEHVQSGRTFSESEAKQIAQSLLEILTYLHGRQPPVIHRDIKPSNILLTDRSGNSPGQVYLVDFGSVQTLTASQGGTITVVGTYGYMPPEQFGGYATPASDLYSLAATLIYVSTGKHPSDLPQKDLCIQFESEAQFSSAFTSWLTWLTAPNSSDRPSSAEQALEALQQPAQISPYVLCPKEVVPMGELLWNSLWRSCSVGFVVGGVISVIDILSIVILIGLTSDASVFNILSIFSYAALGGLLGAVLYGLLAGIPVGFIISIWTRRQYYPLHHPRKYRQTIKAVGTLTGIAAAVIIFWGFIIAGLALTDSDADMASYNVITLVLVTVRAFSSVVLWGLVGGAIGQSVAQWYERRSRIGDPEEEKPRRALPNYKLFFINRS
ncbi:protein kinase [Oculatella sp. FACHB-28]|uniref:serine/threonine protein kinase n=1 Tax=Oculatella sp. FACHB-28 TaxID=2692845 RepID=UPI0016863959|nr:protein kinase [Oculatella sp. FACHB-28]MBD2056493.1 protein kinase [Oculatella sp. FACHB-28]